MGPIKRVSRNLLEAMDDAGQRCSETVSVHKNVSSAPTLSNLTKFSPMDGNRVHFSTESGYLQGNIGSASTLSDIPHYVNPLLRSDSSGNEAIEHNYVYVNNVISGENTNDMHPLQVNEYNSTTAEYLREYDISTLTSDVSKMFVSAEHLRDIENDGIIKETTLLVSTESQRLSCDFEQHRLQICSINSEGKNQVPKSSELSQSGCISLLSTDDSCSVITITDSTASEFMDINLMISDIPESGRSADAFIPNTFSNEKADRMEAFLRDVSQQRREIEANQEMEEDNFTSMRYIDAISPKKNIKTNNAYQIHGGLAYAATESMTSIATDQMTRSVQTDTPVKEDTISISKIKTEDFSSESERSVEDDPRRLAQEETQTNSSPSQEEESNSIVCSENSSTSNVSKMDLPEDSVIISETSSEKVNSLSANNNSCSSEYNQTGRCTLFLKKKKKNTF